MKVLGLTLLLLICSIKADDKEDLEAKKNAWKKKDIKDFKRDKVTFICFNILSIHDSFRQTVHYRKKLKIRQFDFTQKM